MTQPSAGLVRFLEYIRRKEYQREVAGHSSPFRYGKGNSPRWRYSLNLIDLCGGSESLGLLPIIKQAGRGACSVLDSALGPFRSFFRG
jgi:hypothetical protein